MLASHSPPTDPQELKTERVNQPSKPSRSIFHRWINIANFMRNVRQNFVEVPRWCLTVWLRTVHCRLVRSSLNCVVFDPQLAGEDFSIESDFLRMSWLTCGNQSFHHLRRSDQRRVISPSHSNIATGIELRFWIISEVLMQCRLLVCEWNVRYRRVSAVTTKMLYTSPFSSVITILSVFPSRDVTWTLSEYTDATIEFVEDDHRPSHSNHWNYHHLRKPVNCWVKTVTKAPPIDHSSSLMKMRQIVIVVHSDIQSVSHRNRSNVNSAFVITGGLPHSPREMWWSNQLFMCKHCQHARSLDFDRHKMPSDLS